MSLSKEKQAELEILFEKKLSEQYHRGISIGVKTACRAVLDMLNDKSKSYVDRVGAVEKFCKTPFKMSTEIKGEKTDGNSVVADEKSENTDEISE